MNDYENSLIHRLKDLRHTQNIMKYNFERGLKVCTGLDKRLTQLEADIDAYYNSPKKGEDHGNRRL